MVTGDHPLTAEAIARKVRRLACGASCCRCCTCLPARGSAARCCSLRRGSTALAPCARSTTTLVHTRTRAQVGIVTLATQREVAADLGVPLGEVDVTDERVGAVVVTGAELRCVWVCVCVGGGAGGGAVPAAGRCEEGGRRRDSVGRACRMQPC
jgi:magnesium-transporting ATPase (P-type)